MSSVFRNSTDFKDRIQLSSRLKEKFPERIACIVEKTTSWGTRKIPHMERKKFLVPGNMKLCNFVIIIRRRIDLPEGSALLITVGVDTPTMPTMQATLDSLFSSYGSEDGFLYVHYGIESTFGK
jgi:GABA(A) receptor-associated protein